MATATVTLKLLIDTKSKKVLFAEAGKDFVDFLFNLLSLPVGTVIRLLKKDSMVGSLGNVYGSVESLSESYLIQKTHTREALLEPKTTSSLGQVPLLPDYASVNSGKFYTCRNKYNDHLYVSTDPTALCPSCKSKMSYEMAFAAHSGTQVANSSGDNNAGEGGFVKGVVTYMVMDDLVVKPLSTISSITILNQLNVKEVGALKEEVVHLDMAQGVKLLKASLQSKAVLTSVFINGSKDQS